MQKGKKIIVHLITTLERGGAQKILYKLIESNNNHNYKNIIICLTEKTNFSKEFKKYAYRIYFLNGKNIFYFPLLVIKSYLIISKYNPSYIQSWLYHSDLVASMISFFKKKIPIIWTIHHASYSLKYDSFHSKIIVKLLSKISYFIPKRIIFCSDLSFQIHKKIGYRNYGYSIIRNGIDFKEFYPNKELGLSYKNKLFLKDKDFIVGFVGRYDPNKGINCFLKTVKELKKYKKNSIKFIMCGKEMNKKNTLLNFQLIKYNLKNDIILLGEQNDMNSIYNMMDLIICSSITESFGLVVVEALACGKNVICSDIPALRQLVKKEFLIKPESYINFAKKIFYISENKIEYQKNKQTNRNSVLKKYNIEDMVKKYYDTYKF